MLIESYLTGRYQRVIISNGIDTNNGSKWEIINVVFLRARFLVPFFLLYINDLPKIINKNNMVLFADDTSIIVTDTNRLNFERNLQRHKHMV
jgi:hypothetical protein